MRKPNLPYKLEFRMLRKRRDGLCDFEHSRYDVVGGVAKIPVLMLVLGVLKGR